MTILSKACNPDNFESHKSLKLSFTNIRELCSNFVDCESFLESNSHDILALCEANLDDSIDSGNFSVTGYLPIIRKDSSIDCMIFLSPFLDVTRMSVNSFFPRTARLWNSLPIECIPLTYDLSGFKSRINRYLLTVGSF